MKFKYFLSLLIMITIFGCIIPDETDQKTIGTNTPANTNEVDYGNYAETDYSDPNATDPNDSYGATEGLSPDGVYTISYTKDLRIAQTQTFPYCSEPIRNSSMTLQFNTKSIQLILTENNFVWSQDYPILYTWDAELQLNGTLYKNTVSAQNNQSMPIELFLVDKDIVSFKIGTRTYTKKAGPVTKKTTTTAVDDCEPVYMDNHQILVKPGENLKLIIQNYNTDNKTNYTLEQVLNKNTYIKRRTGYAVYPNDIINF